MQHQLLEQIQAENQRLQALLTSDEHLVLEGGYERLQRQVWDLKQTGYSPTVLNRVWFRLVGIGNHDLRTLRDQYQKTLSGWAGLAEQQAYAQGQAELKSRVNQTILLLF